MDDHSYAKRYSNLVLLEDISMNLADSPHNFQNSFKIRQTFIHSATYCTNSKRMDNFFFEKNDMFYDNNHVGPTILGQLTNTIVT